MLVYRFTETLIETDLPYWDELVSNELGNGVHPARQMGFKLAREALRLALCEVKMIIPIKSLKFTAYHSLVGLPQFTLSLSHTPHLGSAVLGSKDLYRSVGIDIEHKDRVVKEHIKQRISHPQDESLRNLHLWCLKEAAFKAIMNTDLFPRPIEFSSIQIGEKSWTHSPSGLVGDWKLEEYKDHIVALAWIKN